jgi:prolyl 4-hydroxylase
MTLTPEDYAYYSAQGDRIATFMGYLTSVELGGATVFPLLGLSSRATKGSAIFWVNLLSDGLRDTLTHHGGRSKRKTLILFNF